MCREYTSYSRKIPDPLQLWYVLGFAEIKPVLDQYISQSFTMQDFYVNCLAKYSRRLNTVCTSSVNYL